MGPVPLNAERTIAQQCLMPRTSVDPLAEPEWEWKWKIHVICRYVHMNCTHTLHTYACISACMHACMHACVSVHEFVHYVHYTRTHKHKHTEIHKYTVRPPAPPRSHNHTMHPLQQDGSHHLSPPNVNCSWPQEGKVTTKQGAFIFSVAAPFAATR